MDRSIDLSIDRSIDLSIYRSIDLSVCLSISPGVRRLALGARRPRDSTHPGQRAAQRCVPELRIPSGTWSIRWRSGCSCCPASDIPLAQTCWHEPVLAWLTSARGFAKTAHHPPLKWKNQTDSRRTHGSARTTTRASTHTHTHTHTYTQQPTATIWPTT